MLHYILAQVSIHLISSMWKRIFHQHWVHVASSRFSTVLVFASLGFCPAFPRGGLVLSMCSQHFDPPFKLFSQDKVLLLLCMSSIYLGRRPDGSSLILARHHGIPTRVGTALFRSVFFALGPDRRIGICILIHLGPGDWRQLRNSNARLLLLFEYSSASAVQSPPVQRVQAPGTPPVSSGPSVSSDSPVSSSGSSNDSP